MNIKKTKLFLNKLCSDYSIESPGISIGIIIENKLLLTQSYGLSDLKNKIKITPKTNFRLASVSKQFTATCVLQLIEKNKLRLEDKIKKYFTEFKNSEITINNLLNHTSGLLNYEDIIRKNRKIPISDKEVLKLVSSQKKYKFKPGRSWDYNNGGYCILKELIEKISGLSYANYLRENIFRPLGMKNSILSERNKTHILNRAYGYSFKNNKFVKTDNNITSFTMGDGSIYSSVQDLYKWVINRNKILSKPLIDLSQSKDVLTDEKDEYYGLGFFIKKLGKNKVVYHGGESIGFRTSIYSVPNKKLSVIVLSNSDKNYGSDLAENIIKFLLK
ncbi:beta-lactamase family protein [archaeon]|nr:beta-lactamase family protein [archaeon]